MKKWIYECGGILLLKIMNNKYCFTSTLVYQSIASWCLILCQLWIPLLLYWYVIMNVVLSCTLARILLSQNCPYSWENSIIILWRGKKDKAKSSFILLSSILPYFYSWKLCLNLASIPFWNQCYWCCYYLNIDEIITHN